MERSTTAGARLAAEVAKQVAGARLAAEVAKQVAGRFADGVWLAELAAVQDPVQVPAAVATALGIRDLPSIAAADALATSREPLRIAREVRYRLGPLTLPDLDNHFLQRRVVRWHTMAREPGKKRVAHTDRLPASSRW